LRPPDRRMGLDHRLIGSQERRIEGADEPTLALKTLTATDGVPLAGNGNGR